jgi:hypothetical protein
MPSVPNLYDTQGLCVGYITKGDNPNDIRGVIYWTTAQKPLVGKAFIGWHSSGYWLIFTITAVYSDAMPCVFVAAHQGQALNFVPKPFGSIQSAFTYLNNMLPIDTAGVRPMVTTWGAAAAAGAGALMLSAPPKRRRR